METLLRAINEILEAKDKEISLLKWEKECLENENTKLGNYINSLKETEANRV